MRFPRAALVPLSLCAVAAGCDGGPLGTEPGTGAPSFAVAEPVCEAIDFNELGHGDQITSASLTGMTINFAVASFVQPDGSPNSQNFLRAFDTGVPNNGKLDPWEDIDLIAPPGGDCADCAGLGRIMVIEDERGFDPWGDYRWGGDITLTGFASGAWIESFAAVDDDNEEPDIVLLVDGVQVAASSGTGDATVETVNVPKTPITTNAVFRFGTSAADEVTGSGGVDDIVVCTPPPPSNPGTGTIGYWKNHPNAWPVSSIVIGGTSYTKAQAIAIMKTPGKGDKTYDMFSQLVAAKLNVMIGNDDSCIADTITDADAWMAAHPVGSGVKASSAAWQQASGWHGELDDYNNGLLCAPHRD